MEPFRAFSNSSGDSEVLLNSVNAPGGCPYLVLMFSLTSVQLRSKDTALNIVFSTYSYNHLGVVGQLVNAAESLPEEMLPSKRPTLNEEFRLPVDEVP